MPPRPAADWRRRVQSQLVSASPYVVNVRDLVHRPGEMRERTLDFAVPEKLGEPGYITEEQAQAVSSELAVLGGRLYGLSRR